MLSVRALRRHPTTQRLFRFGLSALAVQGAYALLMALFLLALGFQRQLALAVSFSGALVIHFTLNRRFVFAPADGYVHGLSSHGRRYLVVSAIGYGLTALGLAVLPELLGIAPYLAWLLVTTTMGVLNFLLLGRIVFR